MGDRMLTYFGKISKAGPLFGLYINVYNYQNTWTFDTISKCIFC